MSARDWAQVLVYVCAFFFIAFVCFALLTLGGQR